MGRVGGGEIIIILLVGLLLFGPSRMSDLAREFGDGLRQLRKGVSNTGHSGPTAKNQGLNDAIPKAGGPPADSRETN